MRVEADPFLVRVLDEKQAREKKDPSSSARKRSRNSAAERPA
jgi:hypothetical protein